MQHNRKAMHAAPSLQRTFAIRPLSTTVSVRCSAVHTRTSAMRQEPFSALLLNAAPGRKYGGADRTQSSVKDIDSSEPSIKVTP